MRFDAVVSMTLLASGCGPGLLDIGTTEVVVSTDRSAYVALHAGGEGSNSEFGFNVLLRVENVGSGTIYLSKCNPSDDLPVYGILPAAPGEPYASAYSPVWACVGHSEAIRLDPGERKTFELRIRGPNTWDGHTGEPQGELTGPMRIVIGVRGTRPWNQTVGGEPPGISNVFEVTRTTPIR